MVTKMTVVYAARTADEAERLLARLAAAGIDATLPETVAEDAMLAQWDLPVKVPVAVDDGHAEEARHIALEFSREVGRLAVIYEARSLPEAEELKRRLLDTGILAMVGSEIVEGESSPDIWGFPVPSRVAVDEGHAQACAPDGRRVRRRSDPACSGGRAACEGRGGRGR